MALKTCALLIQCDIMRINVEYIPPENDITPSRSTTPEAKRKQNFSSSSCVKICLWLQRTADCYSSLHNTKSLGVKSFVHTVCVHKFTPKKAVRIDACECAACCAMGLLLNNNKNKTFVKSLMPKASKRIKRTIKETMRERYKIQISKLQKRSFKQLSFQQGLKTL